MSIYFLLWGIWICLIALALLGWALCFRGSMVDRTKIDREFQEFVREKLGK